MDEDTQDPVGLERTPSREKDGTYSACEFPLSESVEVGVSENEKS